MDLMRDIRTTSYHTTLFSQKSSKKKKSRQVKGTADDNAIQLGRYQMNAQGEWVRTALNIPRSRTAVLSPQLSADIAHVLDQDIDDLDAPPQELSRETSASSAKKAVKRVKQNDTLKNKKKKELKSRKASEEPTKLSKSDKATLHKYKELLNESDFKPQPSHEIRAPTESGEESEQSVTQLVEWLKSELMTDLCVIDLRAKTDWARFMIIATAKSERHNRATAESIAHKVGQSVHPSKLYSSPRSWVKCVARVIKCTQVAKTTG